MLVIRAHLIVSGMVQGVGFRATTQMQADKIGVNGWVKNLSDGTVEIEVEGKPEKVYQLIDIIKEGPSRFIKVNDVHVEVYEDLKGYDSFSVK
ncbi:acylphosphatase [Aquibacillus rhizosphaerae]|uniref:Acylphosphatase n=1 Tax=Aquibacillus rhizosphaerae TaxID=3051431 RepID=A0ABT7L1G7_9BACI|nr:acylphosphatase [Aquibacillus sp. LR5S19]MDL4839703.1 acylphosphatase [Aquibacillus sp. LR5S19]